MSNLRRPRDVNQLAKYVLDLTTGEREEEPVKQKNPAAVELGRLGGLKGQGKRQQAEESRTASYCEEGGQQRWGKA